MKKYLVVAVASIAALSIVACGSSSSSTNAQETTVTTTPVTSSTASSSVDVATCRKGKALAQTWSSDWNAYWSVAQNNPTGADPSGVEQDLTGLGSILSTLAQEDTNSADVQRITAEQQGIGHLQTAVQLLHGGDTNGFATEAEQGLSAIEGFGKTKLAICRGV